MEKQVSNTSIKLAQLLIKRFWSNPSILFTLTFQNPHYLSNLLSRPWKQRI